MESTALQLVENVVECWRQGRHIPGVALVVVSSTEILHLHCSGVASLASMSPVTPQTQFQLGPTSRSLTAEGVVQLIERGAVSMDDPVNQILPGLNTTLTIEELLDGSGHLDPRHDPESGEWRQEPVPSLLEWVQRFEQMPASIRMALYSPGPAFSILGAVIEECSRQAYAAYMRDIIFLPLEMYDTVASLAEAKQEQLADGHYNFDSSSTFSPVLPRPVPAYVPVGGIFSTGLDVGRYLMARLRANTGSQFAENSQHVGEDQQCNLPLSRQTFGWDGRVWRVAGKGVEVVGYGGYGTTTSSAFVVSSTSNVGVGILVNAPAIEVLDVARSAAAYLS